MKIAIVSPEFPFSARVPMVPPILEYLGALTLREAPGTELQLLDANQRPVDPATIDADLVCVSVWTATAPWAYRFADGCRAAGRRVVLGGIHATALPDEAASHADAVVVGEAESVWGELLGDARTGRLRPRYLGEQRPLAGLVQPIDAGLRGNYRFRAFFTMRGCPYACSFCSVHQFFGRSIRYRPVDEVVDEVEARAGRIWFNGDDNIWGADPDRAVALFDALASGTRRAWYGFGDLRSVQGPTGERLLRAARRSGLSSVWAGWESDDAACLAAFGAAGKQGLDRVEAVKRMQGHGLDVVLFQVLGGRQEGLDSFRRTLELADRLQVNVHPVLLTPLPGTRLYQDYRQHLLPGLGWEAFTGVRALFEHPDPAMTPAARERAFHELCRELYRPRRILRRLAAIPRAGFPAVHAISLMKQLPMKRALGKARAAWLAEQPPAPVPARPAPVPPGRLAGALASVRTFAAGVWLAASGSAILLAHETEEAMLASGVEHLLELSETARSLGWGSLATVSLASVLKAVTGGVERTPGRRRQVFAAVALVAGLAVQVALAPGQ
jgi:hypothetical protein